MTGVTVEQLAKQIGSVSLDKLKEQLQRAGVRVTKDNDVITEEEKEKLLALLRQEHSSNNATAFSNQKISLKRTSVSTIKVKQASGKSSIVNVISKKRRVYVKKEIADLLKEDEIALETKVEEQLPVTEVLPPVIANPAEAPQEAVVADAVPVATKVAETKDKVEAETAKPKTKDKEKEKDETSKNRRKVKAKAQEADTEESSKAKEKPRKVSKAKLLQTVMNEDEEVHYKVKAKGGKLDLNRKHKKEQVEEINPHAFAKPIAPIIYEVKIPETITVAELAQKISVKGVEIIKALMKMGTMVTINQVIDQDIACIVVEELGHKACPIKGTNIEELMPTEYTATATLRSPIITVMGHVDHGKTSLLDYLRRTSIAAGEAGGITQHIGAYQVETTKGLVTFLDTPGHSAFTAMRARGASCTDIVVLVVAADDGVMPQTVEAIQHAKAAKVPIIVAVNKIDKPEADLDKVTNELSQYELIPESWGGDTIFVPISAKQGTGIDSLLDAIMLQAEMLELTAPASGLAQGVVLEAYLDKGRGPVATLLIQKGQLQKGDMILVGTECGRIKVMHNDSGVNLVQAGPSVPVEVLGLSGVPMAGDKFQAIADERKAKEIAELRQGKSREVRLNRQQSTKLEGFMDRMQQGELKTLNIVLKADVQGSIEALVDALEQLSTEEVSVKVIAKGVGGFNESDINLAIASEAFLVGFNVRADATARKLAVIEGIKINYYSVIYDIIDGIKAAIHGKIGPKYVEKILGTAEVREVFRSSKIGAIAGCMVIDGIIKRGNPIRVLRNNVVIYTGELESLRRFKDNVNEVRNNMECGIGVKNYNDIKIGDQIEVYEVVEVKVEL